MKDAELNSRLNSLRAPERDADFWEAFPERVMGELRAAQTEPVLVTRRRASPLRSLGVGWAAGLTVACLAAGICLGQSQTPRAACYALLKEEKELRQTVGQIPAHVRALMQDEHGLDKLIEDQP